MWGSAPRPGRFTPGKDPVRIIQEAGWAPGPVWTCAENLTPTGIRSPNRPARSESLYRLSYRGPRTTDVRTTNLYEYCRLLTREGVQSSRNLPTLTGKTSKSLRFYTLKTEAVVLSETLVTFNTDIVFTVHCDKIYNRTNEMHVFILFLINSHTCF